MTADELEAHIKLHRLRPEMRKRGQPIWIPFGWLKGRKCWHPVAWPWPMLLRESIARCDYAGRHARCDASAPSLGGCAGGQP